MSPLQRLFHAVPALKSIGVACPYLQLSFAEPFGRSGMSASVEYRAGTREDHAEIVVTVNEWGEDGRHASTPFVQCALNAETGEFLLRDDGSEEELHSAIQALQEMRLLSATDEGDE